MKTLVALLLAVVVAGCGSQAMPELPEGVTCNDEALANIRENPPDEAKADPDSTDFNQWYMLSYYRTAGCDTPEPSIEPTVGS